VIVVEDILDTGMTLQYLLRVFEAAQATTPAGGGFAGPNQTPPGESQSGLRRLYDSHEFVVGYGLDYAERYRNLADVEC